MNARFAPLLLKKSLLGAGRSRMYGGLARFYLAAVCGRCTSSPSRSRKDAFSSSSSAIRAFSRSISVSAAWLAWIATPEAEDRTILAMQPR